MPLDEAGNVYQPVLELPAGLCFHQEVYVCRFTGETFLEYMCAPCRDNAIDCKHKHSLCSVCYCSVSHMCCVIDELTGDAVPPAETISKLSPSTAAGYGSVQEREWPI